MPLYLGLRQAGPIIAMLVLAGCASEGPANAPPAADVAATVEMTNTFGFSPQTIHIKAGDTVEWRNKSFMTHTVTDDPQKSKTLAEIPAGAAPFDSGRIPSGQVFRQKFTTPGTYRYYCTPHDDLGMTGTIVVDPAN